MKIINRDCDSRKKKHDFFDEMYIMNSVVVAVFIENWHVTRFYRSHTCLNRTIYGFSWTLENTQPNNVDTFFIGKQNVFTYNCCISYVFKT